MVSRKESGPAVLMGMQVVRLRQGFCGSMVERGTDSAGEMEKTSKRRLFRIKAQRDENQGLKVSSVK